MTFVEAFSLTVAVEVPLYALGLVALGLLRTGGAVLAGLAVNLLTHPVLWLTLAGGASAGQVIAAELCVCLVEAAALRIVLRRHTWSAVLLAVGANAASFGVGLVVTAAGG